MSEETFNILNETDVILICDSCNNGTIDAYHLPCGCQYCSNCINGKVKCLGKNELCNKEIINIDDVTKKPLARQSINRSIFKCKNVFCNYKGNVDQINLHLKNCGKSNSQSLLEFNKENIDFNVVKSQEKYLNMLASLNKELKSRLRHADFEKVYLNQENKKLKEKINEYSIYKIMNEDLMKELEDLRNANEEMKNTDKENYVLRKLESSENENLVLKEKYAEIDEKYSEMMEKYDKIQKQMENSESKNKENEQIEEEFERKHLSPLSWVVGDITEKKKWEEVIWSPGFYSDEKSYKVEVGIGFGISGLIIQFWCRILKGENDDQLIWPCTKSIKIKMMNQKTGNEYDKIVIRFSGTAACQPKCNKNPAQLGNMSLSSTFLECVVKNNAMLLICQVVD